MCWWDFSLGLVVILMFDKKSDASVYFPIRGKTEIIAFLSSIPSPTPCSIFGKSQCCNIYHTQWEEAFDFLLACGHNLLLAVFDHNWKHIVTKLGVIIQFFFLQRNGGALRYSMVKFGSIHIQNNMIIGTGSLCHYLQKQYIQWEHLQFCMLPSPPHVQILCHWCMHLIPPYLICMNPAVLKAKLQH